MRGGGSTLCRTRTLYGPRERRARYRSGLKGVEIGEFVTGAKVDPYRRVHSFAARKRWYPLGRHVPGFQKLWGVEPGRHLNRPSVGPHAYAALRPCLAPQKRLERSSGHAPVLLVEQSRYRM